MPPSTMMETTVKLRMTSGSDDLQSSIANKYVPADKYFELKTRYQSAQKKCSYLQKTYEKYAEQIIERNGMIDSLETEIIDRNALLSEKENQLKELEQRYIELLNNHSIVEAKLRAFSSNSWLIKRIDNLHDKLNREINLGWMDKVIVFLSKLMGSKQYSEPLTENAAPDTKSSWFSIGRAMPIKTGMYRVSDGRSETYTYYDSESHTFSNKEFATRYWQVVV